MSGGVVRVHFIRDDTIVVKTDTHGPSTVFNEVFGRLIKMKNVFSCHLLLSRYFKILLMFFP